MSEELDVPAEVESNSIAYVRHHRCHPICLPSEIQTTNGIFQKLLICRHFGIKHGTREEYSRSQTNDQNDPYSKDQWHKL